MSAWKHSHSAWICFFSLVLAMWWGQVTSLWAGGGDRDSFPAKWRRKELPKPTHVPNPKCHPSFPCTLTISRWPTAPSGTDALWWGAWRGCWMLWHRDRSDRSSLEPSLPDPRDSDTPQLSAEASLGCHLSQGSAWAAGLGPWQHTGFSPSSSCSLSPGSRAGSGQWWEASPAGKAEPSAGSRGIPTGCPQEQKILFQISFGYSWWTSHFNPRAQRYFGMMVAMKWLIGRPWNQSLLFLASNSKPQCDFNLWLAPALIFKGFLGREDFVWWCFPPSLLLTTTQVISQSGYSHVRRWKNHQPKESSSGVVIIYIPYKYIHEIYIYICIYLYIYMHYMHTMYTHIYKEYLSIFWKLYWHC